MRCNACQDDLPATAFSQTQIHQKSETTRRCTLCIQAGRLVVTPFQVATGTAYQAPRHQHTAATLQSNLGKRGRADSPIDLTDSAPSSPKRQPTPAAFAVPPAPLSPRKLTTSKGVEIDSSDGESLPTVLLVASDFMQGRADYEEQHSKAPPEYRGAHQRAAAASLQSAARRTWSVDFGKRGQAFWKQFERVGPTISKELVEFFASIDLTPTSTSAECEKLYWNGVRRSSWQYSSSWSRHANYTPNEVARMGEQWIANQKKAELAAKKQARLNEQIAAAGGPEAYSAAQEAERAAKAQARRTAAQARKKTNPASALASAAASAVAAATSAASAAASGNTESLSMRSAAFNLLATMRNEDAAKVQAAPRKTAAQLRKDAAIAAAGGVEQYEELKRAERAAKARERRQALKAAAMA